MGRQPHYNKNNSRILISTRKEFTTWLNQNYKQKTYHKRLLKLKEEITNITPKKIKKHEYEDLNNVRRRI